MKENNVPSNSNTDVTPVASHSSAPCNSFEHFEWVAYEVQEEVIGYMVKDVLFPKSVQGRYGNYMSFSEALRSYTGYLMQWIERKVKAEKEVIGYRVTQDCTLDRTNFYEGDEIIIEDHAYDYDWKGTEWYDQFPQIFVPIYLPNPEECDATKADKR